MARALIGVGELDSLEGLLQQHLRVQRRTKALHEQAAQYDTVPAELQNLEAEAERLRSRLKAVLGAWQERL